MSRKVGRIRDVAKATGLSIATVSRVVNGVGNVRAQTREKVLEACEKLDYLPNPAARALSTNRSKTIAAKGTRGSPPIVHREIYRTAGRPSASWQR